ncbi:lipoate-protein ligase A [Scopulibacillus darangshiensis]|uniref:Lipoate-protein ligase A n=1 Tax=Scopulibacillus darangshiensis TaxID=442528 RepID=A0A4R2NKM2_9BACL|nr:biotin/lipoate A/B protein ligase family protein [Scopulibacillus darangshiensis]TCP21922.1 lipoate-protein ligase A [Scopulibacillus darangshiensis]
MEKEAWLFVDSGMNTPAYNMAMDEALLEWHSKGLIPPVLRFYGWNPPGLSVGYFQKVHGKIDLDAVKRYGFNLVRRQTGGRAVLHDNELTYSVIVNEDHDKMPKSVTEAYRVISKGLLNGFKELGIEADFAVPEEGKKIGQTNSAVCFDEPSWYELIVGGKKAAGSAQTRQKGVILQHGSIPIDIDDQVLFDCFIYPNDRVKERALKGFQGKAAAINDLAGRDVTLDEIKQAFYKGFETGLDIQLEPYELNEDQLKEIKELEEKYLTDEWNYSR